MRMIRRLIAATLVAAAALIGGLGTAVMPDAAQARLGGAAVRTVEAAVGYQYNCFFSGDWTGAPQTSGKCTQVNSDYHYNGLARVVVVCFNGVSYKTVKGPWVLVNTWSTAACGWPYYTLGGYTYMERL